MQRSFSTRQANKQLLVVFDLSSRTWASMRLLEEQTGSYGNKAVWTGEELVTWGRDSGGRFMP